MGALHPVRTRQSLLRGRLADPAHHHAPAGTSDALWLACVFLAFAGAADMVSAVFRTAILIQSTPDAMRGRLNGVFIIVVAGGPRLGDVEAGAAEALGGLRFAVVSGGLACIVGVVVAAMLMPSFARYDSRHPEP